MDLMDHCQFCPCTPWYTEGNWNPCTREGPLAMNEVKVLLYESARLIATLKILLRKFEAETLLHLLQGLQMVMWCQSLSENRKVYSMFMTCHLS